MKSAAGLHMISENSSYVH